MDTTRLYVITGASGAGKSTLLNALGDRGYSVVPELALSVLQEQEERGDGLLPGVNLQAFMDEVLARNVHAYDTARAMKPPVFFDRGIPECLAHMRLLALNVEDEQAATRMIRRYADPVFVAEPWPEIYACDHWRCFPFERAERSFAPTVAAYVADGYRLCILPKRPLDERVAFVLRQVTADG